MRASNKNKGLTPILGLFLTAAMPLCISIISAPSTIAAEKEDVRDQDVVANTIKKLKELAEEDSDNGKVRKIIPSTFSPTGDLTAESGNNFGAATNVMAQILTDRNRPKLLNDLLLELSDGGENSLVRAINKSTEEIVETLFGLLDATLIGSTETKVKKARSKDAQTLDRLYSMMGTATTYRYLVEIERKKVKVLLS
ncbi:hypothetical protein [Candidatus Paracaedibacter symbiosus]|uniref:hypothetical protein n=1 Tax=Candidatus Paracaedibacter symbiosus TaxID=244582 RepID=UPI00050991CF|nr:hypothetical protein [Candidatus Paracaedibacter symbiosus]